ncbi:DUF4191 domain-containing protein [Lapillicoccus jejuensis]|uniref:Uncharacterized protein DUF4191 n=1 Tax=Lapillicoccus jejuensis TaxID=402171 RepID=A0A542E5T0_9MICO|nr:DUF4191 domain-containing protein [Lapillicoccus jejuensis]TQJ10693.1 uncharacterized protein DUF4191 [Lapillicoccus jejuensis]
MAKDAKDPQDAGTAKKPGRFAQLRQIFDAARQVDPRITWWMLGAFLVTVAVVTGIGALLGHWLYALFLGILFGLLAALVTMSRRAEKAAYRQIEGQVGAASAALTSLRRGWFYDREPVAADAQKPGDLSGAALVYRATGRPGIVLVGEGPRARVAKLLAAERKRVERVAPGVPVTLVRVGDGDDEIPLTKLVGRVQRLKPVLTKDEVSVVNKRLKALGGMRPPLPKGVDPSRAAKQRMDRRALRGR